MNHQVINDSCRERQKRSGYLLLPQAEGDWGSENVCRPVDGDAASEEGGLGVGVRKAIITEVDDLVGAGDHAFDSDAQVRPRDRVVQAKRSAEQRAQEVGIRRAEDLVDTEPQGAREGLVIGEGEHEPALRAAVVRAALPAGRWVDPIAVHQADKALGVVAGASAREERLQPDLEARSRRQASVAHGKQPELRTQNELGFAVAEVGDVLTQLSVQLVERADDDVEAVDLGVRLGRHLLSPVQLAPDERDLPGLPGVSALRFFDELPKLLLEGVEPGVHLLDTVESHLDEVLVRRTL